MKTPPAFQYYPRDLLCDANVMAMSLEELGAYWKLVSVCWLELGLPGTETGLARLLQIPAARFRKLWPALERCFVLDEQGRYQHPRLNKERAKQDEYRARQAEKGRKSGANRKATEDEPEGNREATEPEPEGNSAICDLQSADSSQVVEKETPQQLADLWNDVTTAPIKRCKGMTDERRRKAKARLLEHPLSEWREIFLRIEASDFCRGGGRDRWVAGFDFVLQKGTAMKVLEGTYDNRAPVKPVGVARLVSADAYQESADWQADRQAMLERQKAKSA